MPEITEANPFLSRPRSIAEVAEYMDCTAWFIQQEIALGKLRARKLSPKLVRILPADLREWLDRADTTKD